MPTLAVLAIVVAVGEANAPTTAGLLAAARKALIAGTVIRVYEVPAPSDAAALGFEDDLGARASLTLTWEDAAHLRAHIRLHVARTDRWTDRQIRFSSVDDPRERGRALGFAIASMWPEGAAATHGAAQPPPQASTAPVPAARPPPSPSSHTIEAAVTAAQGIGGPAQGLGGRLEAGVFITRTVALHLSLAARAGPIDALPGTDLVGALAAGGEWWPLAPSATRRIGLGVQGDVAVLRHQIFANSGGGQFVTLGRFVPAVAVGPEAAIQLTSDVEILLDAGVELALGHTDLLKDSPAVLVTTIPAARVVADAGLRLRF